MKAGKIILLILGLLFLWFVYSALTSTSRTSSVRDNPAPATETYNVVYRVLGTSRSADVTYQNRTGDTEQKEIRASGGFTNQNWTYEFTAELGDFAYISVQNGQDTGTIECIIMVNNQVWKQAESNTDYGIATCSGSVGRE